MSSVLARTKQIPTDSQYFVSLRCGLLNLQYFTPDAAASTTSYVSGAAAGNFTTSNVPAGTAFDTSNNTFQLFRDMGLTVVSSGRTFRGIQLLLLDASGGVPGSSGWTATTGAGVWKPSNGGVVGVASTTSAESSFGNFYFETGAGGLGLAQGLVRYG